MPHVNSVLSANLMSWFTLWCIICASLFPAEASSDEVPVLKHDSIVITRRSRSPYRVTLFAHDAARPPVSILLHAHIMQYTFLHLRLHTPDLTHWAPRPVVYCLNCSMISCAVLLVARISSHVLDFTVNCNVASLMCSCMQQRHERCSDI